MCADNPPYCDHFLRAEEERRKAASVRTGHRREFHLVMADIFHARHAMAGADDEAYDRFSGEIKSLHGDALLRRKLLFDRLPKPITGQRELHLAQHLCLVAALIREFGSVKWELALGDFRAANPNA
jgi:hypothetical protein